MSKFLSEVKGFTPVIDILAQEVGLMAAVVYGIAWRYCQMEDRICSASRERIAEHANISIKTVERHLKKLCKAGYLEDLTPTWKHKPHIYADSGRAKIKGLLIAEVGKTESLTSEPGETESPEGETESPTRSDIESNQGKTESLIRIPSYDREQEREEGKKTDSFSEKPNPDLFDLALKTEQARDRYGDYTIPSSAGGSFALGDRLVAVACARLGRSEPEGQKRKNARAFFEKALRAEGLLQGDVAMLEKAVEEWLDPEGEYAFFLPQYELTTKHELALRHFGIVLSKAKVQVTVESDRRICDVEAMEASLMALEERKATRPPPIEGDMAWETAKRELRLQMTKPDFDVWIRDTVGLGREDGIYTVAVPDARARDWLESRLKKTAERTLIGILDESVEVRFEVES